MQAIGKGSLKRKCGLRSRFLVDRDAFLQDLSKDQNSVSVSHQRPSTSTGDLARLLEEKASRILTRGFKGDVTVAEINAFLDQLSAKDANPREVFRGFIRYRIVGRFLLLLRPGASEAPVSPPPPPPFPVFQYSLCVHLQMRQAFVLLLRSPGVCFSLRPLFVATALFLPSCPWVGKSRCSIPADPIFLRHSSPPRSRLGSEELEWLARIILKSFKSTSMVPLRPFLCLLPFAPGVLAICRVRGSHREVRWLYCWSAKRIARGVVVM